MAEFGVYGIEFDGDQTIITGRCYKGPLRKADVFCAVRMPPGAHWSPVQLTVERMVAYRHELDEIWEGLTARIFLRGRGSEMLQTGCILTTE